MTAIDPADAGNAIRSAAITGYVRAATTTRNGRPVHMTLPLADAELQVTEAAALDWVDDDPDQYHLHVTTAGGRTIRLDAIHPDGPPRPIG